MSPISSKAGFSGLVQNFFCQRLIVQRNASAQTIASYRDCFRLLLKFIAGVKKISPTDLMFTDLEAPLILDFLDHLEKKRGNSIRTRNNRLAAIRSFMRYASLQEPSCLLSAQRVLAIPMKRFERPLIDFLTHGEVQTIIDAPDLSTWSGHRDHIMIATLYNTGARVSEIINLQIGHLVVGRKCYLKINGKGRKQRAVPLWKNTAAKLKKWLVRVDNSPEAPIFPNRMGKALSRAGVEYRLREAVRKATKHCPSLIGRRISPHTLRHTTAMHLLQSGVDITVIALWLGHESPATTHLYVDADLTMKERALSKIQEPSIKASRYVPTDDLLAFLESL